jgi:hypothetical protein
VWKEVVLYSLSWRADKQQGEIRVTCEDDTEGRIEVSSAQELEALGSMLRNEKPIYYSEQMQALRTGSEPPGEEESD